MDKPFARFILAFNNFAGIIVQFFLLQLPCLASRLQVTGRQPANKAFQPHLMHSEYRFRNHNQSAVPAKVAEVNPPEFVSDLSTKVCWCPVQESGPIYHLAGARLLTSGWRWGLAQVIQPGVCANKGRLSC